MTGQDWHVQNIQVVQSTQLIWPLRITDPACLTITSKGIDPLLALSGNFQFAFSSGWVMAERYISLFSHPLWKEKLSYWICSAFATISFANFFQTRAVSLDLVSVTFLQNDGNAETENVKQICFFIRQILIQFSLSMVFTIQCLI